MKVLFDTSVLIAATISSHPHHHAAKSWFKKIISKKIEMTVSSHNLAEYYSVVTKLPLSPRVSPGVAIQLIENNIMAHTTPIHLTSKDILSAIKLVTNMELSGGIIYDAIIYTAAIKADAEKILTFNIKHFRQLCPDNPKFIVEP